MRSLVTTFVMSAATTAAAMAMQAPAPLPAQLADVTGFSELLTHSALETCAPAGPTRASARARFASWNIKAARSAAVSDLIAEMRAMEADVIALQEVDVRTRRSGFVDQPATISSALGFNYAFAASILWDEGHYGLALVSRWPLVHVARHRMGGADLGEPRIVLDVTVCVAGRPLRVLNHHADRRNAARELGFVELQRIATAARGHGLLVMGDMNERADGPGIRSLLDAGLVDLEADGTSSTPRSRRIDYLFADAALSPHAAAARVWTTDKSDHHALLTDLEW
jgi:endonuclease/exonuclease/phosphatase family metal-dependent hydrolase